MMLCNIALFVVLFKWGPWADLFFCFLFNSYISDGIAVGLELIFLLFMLLQTPHVCMTEPFFTVGQGRHCNLWLKDPTIGSVLCKLSHIEVEFPL